LNKRLPPLILAVPCFLPLLWRLLHKGVTEPAGLLSDCALGLLVYFTALYSPYVIRTLLIVVWAVFQAGSQELLAAMQRLPAWQDLHYIADPTFVENSVQSLHLASPLLLGILLFSALFSCFFKVKRPGKTFFFKGLALFVGLLTAQVALSRYLITKSVAARYNPLQWIIVDAIHASLQAQNQDLPLDALPPSLRTLDLTGTSLLSGKGRAKNALIVVMEGVPGLYYPDIRRAMRVPAGPFEMTGLAGQTAGATLVPDFVDHSHQTIRGLYAMLCGDFSKFSYEMPKAMELQENPGRGQECLPAQMAKHGWDTHFLQGAGLAFMNKDQVMPVIGFRHVHGTEWFSEADPFPFNWGKTDPVFFRGARKYIADLQAQKQPWLLTLLTVGTHQPYAAPDDIAARYPNRMIATTAILDAAVADFLKGIREDGVLEDTLVIITSDESHGDEIGDWASSWGLMVILAPEQQQLPRIKQGSYGMVDVTASILDYFGIKPPASVIGRSFFRDYARPREMLSLTESKLRWHTADNKRYECTRNGDCSVGTAPSIIGFPPADFGRDTENHSPRLFAMATALDHKIADRKRPRLLHFANGEILKLPEKITNEWTDNLVRAQFLDFPAGTKAHVSIRIKALQTPQQGIQLKLIMRQYEKVVGGIDAPPFPIMHTGDEDRVAFDIYNPNARLYFSFHLIGVGKDAVIKMEEFDVNIARTPGLPATGNSDQGHNKDHMNSKAQNG
jgi:Sulfatase